MLDFFQMSFPPTVAAVATALAVGALIGLERGWRERERTEGSRVAGLRTFALFGLLGGALGVISDPLGAWPAVAGLAGLSLLVSVSYRESVRVHGNLSATTAVAALMTYSLGVMAGVGHYALALGAAVIVALLLNLKPTLHRWLRMLEYRELSAALQLLVLSVVILPLLPDTAYGPYSALNPYRLWWAVVIIASLSMGGHIAMRFTGPERGLFWTGVLGGLASSTVATLALARRARADPALTRAAAAGTLAACGMMFLRMTVIVLSIQPALFQKAGVPMVAAGVVLLGLGGWQWKQRTHAAAPAQSDQLAPFDLSMALGFGLLLGFMAVVAQVATQWLGSSGLFLVAGLSGLADVDAITVTVLRMQASGGLPDTSSVMALGIAVTANMITKASIASVAGSSVLGRQVAAGYLVSMVTGVLVVVAMSLA